MMPPLITEITKQNSDVQSALLELNNAHARETSHLTDDHWQMLIGGAFSATCMDADALLIAFDQEANYDNANFKWFHDRYDKFVYVDRIIVSENLRGTSAGRKLYQHLFGLTKRAGREWVVCEINIDPPNPGSDAFHHKIGFVEVGRAELTDRGKTVRYLAKSIDPIMP